MKVLFLDIDGVLNSERTRVAFKGFPMTLEDADTRKLDHVALALVRRLCDETGAKVVMSSSWRIYFKAEEFAEKLELPVIDVTPNFFDKAGLCRGDEIAAWLSANPEVTSYAIVDDWEAMCEDQLESFVKTKDADGLSYSDYLRLLMILQPLPAQQAA